MFPGNNDICIDLYEYCLFGYTVYKVNNQNTKVKH